MENRATIVMYHYVRELERTRHPRLTALRVSEFEAQLSYLQRHYELVRVEDCIAAIHDGADLPSNAALLTFDDGYADHYTTVFPLLAERGIQGAFFPPVAAVADRTMLNVNKIQFVLAAAPSLDAVLGDVFALLDELRPAYGLDANDVLFRTLARAGRFDTAETMFVKRLLQRGLPRAARDMIADRLFARYVSADVAGFTDELYLTTAQLRTMIGAGMFVGAHGVDHEWLGELQVEEQIDQVEGSLAFLRDLGVALDGWAMCYPNGSYDDSLLGVLSERGCALALTTRPGIAALTSANALTLERLDTNDLPKRADAAPVEWTRSVVGR